jgi:serine/threonine-protein kinase RsbW
VALAREALAGLAETIALSPEQFDDMRTAVTEACNNVVQHAYAGGPGPMEMDVRVVRDAVEVSVRDRGVGIGRAGGGPGEIGSLEIGLPVILALTERLQVSHPPEGGTEMQMRFGVPGVEGLGGRRKRRRVVAQEVALPDFEPAARVAFSSVELARAILPRVACALAARAHLSSDRVSDVQLLADALAAGGPDGSHLEVALAVGRRRLDMQVGPFPRGGGARLLEASRLPGVGAGGDPVSPVQRLADAWAFVPIGPEEVLTIGVCDSP